MRQQCINNIALSVNVTLASTVYTFSNGNTKVLLFEYQSGVSSCSCDSRSRAANCAVAVVVVATWEQVSILWYRRYPARAVAPSKSRLMKVTKRTRPRGKGRVTLCIRSFRIADLFRKKQDISRGISRDDADHGSCKSRNCRRIDRIDHISMMSLWQTRSCDSSFPAWLLASSIADYHYQRNELSLML